MSLQRSAYHVWCGMTLHGAARRSKSARRQQAARIVHGSKAQCVIQSSTDSLQAHSRVLATLQPTVGEELVQITIECMAKCVHRAGTAQRRAQLAPTSRDYPNHDVRMDDPHKLTELSEKKAELMRLRRVLPTSGKVVPHRELLVAN